MSLSLRTQQLQFDPEQFVQYRIFFPLILGDIGLILLTILVWKFILWVPINKLRIRNIKQNKWYQIGSESSIFTTLEYLRNILKTLSQPTNYIIQKCGFEAFTILYFQRKVALILTVLCITDFCIWIPYQLFFNPLSQFSLKKMESVGNDDFRTFYTIWVATLILYSLNHMQNYIRIQLTYYLYRNPEQRIINNLKAKTLYVNFLGQKYYTEAQVKAYTQQYLVQEMGVEDRILAVLTIPNYFDHLQIQYKLKIIEIISQLKRQDHNFSRLWECVKGKADDQIEIVKNQTIIELQNHIRDTPTYIEGCFIIVSQMQTAEGLCHQFQAAKAISTVCPQFYYGQSQEQIRLQNRNLIVKWAQEPNDIIWINMTMHTRQICNFLIFNAICWLLLLASFSSILFLPSYKLPFLKAVQSVIPAILNSTLRFFISKMVEFEKKLFRSEQQIKEFKILCVYFFVNLILGSLFRDVTNLTSLLQTGWGFIEVIKLIYRKIDGLFYYLFIFNQMTFTFIDILIRPGQLFLDCFDSKVNYEKCTKVKQDSTYGQNDAFRFGYFYAIDFIVLSIIILYSVSNPLIHFFGVIFFYTRYHLNGYALLTFHSQNVNSNTRLITKVVQIISIMVALWIFLTATSLIFQRKYSNSIVLYLYCGVVIYFTAISAKVNSINDIRTQEDIKSINLSKYIEQWKRLYKHPFRPQQYLKQYEEN